MNEDHKTTGYDWSKRRRPDAVEWGMIFGLVIVGSCYALAWWLGFMQ